MIYAENINILLPHEHSTKLDLESKMKLKKFIIFDRKPFI